MELPEPHMTTEGAALSIMCADEQRLRAKLEEAHTALELERAERRRLERAVIEVSDNERRRLAQMLHDTICQSLEGITLLSRVVQRRLEAAGREEAKEVAELGQMIQEGAGELHSVVRWLRPAAVDGPDLISALSQLAPSLFQGIPCEFRCPAPVVLSDQFTASQLIQIAHQAANDALKRPGIQRIVVSLFTEDRHVTLMVKDDGNPPQETPTAEDLAGRELLRLRARAIGATLAITSQAGEGTSILCKLPHSN
jgi:two-component system CheB/CheR fusion protein